MPQTTKAQTQSDLLYTAEALLTAAIVLEDDLETEEIALFEDQEAFDADLVADDISEILELYALDWIAIAAAMSGDGSRGAYDQIIKSKDFFSVCLQAPDREFRHMFRSSLTPGIQDWQGDV
ncbi:hypothetical protein B0H16DRAFT_1462622 [Mycena metata]|uniref:Uncharacterized protein n=1 Tax=Mycena metata TaxID=1033252 RepID=A0AAD7INB0_9AGAR|nr:hypothetical protein B0H16DRAFT_1462622 [Mycena metata]